MLLVQPHFPSILCAWLSYDWPGSMMEPVIGWQQQWCGQWEMKNWTTVLIAQLFEVTSYFVHYIRSWEEHFWQLLCNNTNVSEQVFFWLWIISFWSLKLKFRIGKKESSYSEAITSTGKSSIHIVELWNDLSTVEFCLPSIAWDKQNCTDLKIVIFYKIYIF